MNVIRTGFVQLLQNNTWLPYSLGSFVLGSFVLHKFLS